METHWLKPIRARFRGQESRNLRVGDSDGRPGTPKLSGLDVAERPACGDPPPFPGPAAHGLQQGDVVRSKDSSREDLTTHNRSLSDHAPLYAMFILALGLGIVATPLVLLALLLF